MKNIKLKYTDKGYSYIECTREDCFDWGGVGICDYCNKPMYKEVYLIFILGSAYCPECFNEWIKRSERDEEDLYLQKLNHKKWYSAHGFDVGEYK